MHNRITLNLMIVAILFSPCHGVLCYDCELWKEDSVRILLDNEEVLATVTQYTGTLAPLNYTTKPGGPPETTAYVPTEPHTQSTVKPSTTTTSTTVFENSVIELAGCDAKREKWLDDECPSLFRACYKLEGKVYATMDNKVGVFQVTKRGCFHNSSRLLEQGKVGECVDLKTGTGEGETEAVAQLCVCDDKESGPCNAGTRLTTCHVVTFSFFSVLVLVTLRL